MPVRHALQDEKWIHPQVNWSQRAPVGVSWVYMSFSFDKQYDLYADKSAKEMRKARERLDLLTMIESTGNISAACRHLGFTRSDFYKFKRRFEAEGIEGLFDKPSVRKDRPLTGSSEVIVDVETCSLKNPTWGCDRIARYFNEQGFSISPPTVQTILNKCGLGKRKDRWLRLEKLYLTHGYPMSPEALKFVEEMNPRFKARHLSLGRSQQLVIVDLIRLPHLKIYADDYDRGSRFDPFVEDTPDLGLYHSIAPQRLVRIDAFSSYVSAYGYDSLTEGDLIESVERYIRGRDELYTYYETDNIYVHTTFAVRKRALELISERHEGEYDDRLIELDDNLAGHVEAFRTMFVSSLRQAIRGRTFARSDLSELENRIIATFNRTPLLGYPNQGAAPVDLSPEYYEEDEDYSDDYL